MITFGLGQSAPVTPNTAPMMIAPVLPQDVALKCNFDPAANAWRCGYPGFFEQPSTYLIGIVGIAALGLGYFIGKSEPFKRFVKQAAAIVK